MSAKVISRQAGDVRVLDIIGAITMGEGSNAVRDALRGEIDGNWKKILINMKEVSYIESSGIRELLSAYNALSKVGGKVKLVNLTPRTTREGSAAYNEAAHAVRDFR